MPFFLAVLPKHLLLCSLMHFLALLLLYKLVRRVPWDLRCVSLVSCIIRQNLAGVELESFCLRSPALDVLTSPEVAWYLQELL